MKAHIRHIGLVDTKGVVHSVALTPGVNVITGKSSTGKSALIEIFDYCFGSSEFTVPEGVITKHAAVYFVVLRVADTNLILARNPSEKTAKKAFYKEDFGEELAADTTNLSLAYFDEDEFVPLSDFNKAIGKRFGLVFTDVDEDLEARKRRPFGRHAPSPSIRSFTSFMLQHQNLIANKHAIFYRFDEKEKREQVIEHFKVFMGFVTPEYFQLKQELTEWERQLKALESQLPRAEEIKAESVKRVELALADFSAASGTALVDISAQQMVSIPADALVNVRAATVNINTLSEESARQREALERKRSMLLSERREEQNRLRLVTSSIEDVKRYLEQAVEVPVPNEEGIVASLCPFCENHHSGIEHEANKLAEAIEWLNEELRRSSYMPISLAEDEAKISRALVGNSAELRQVDEQIRTIEQQAEALAQGRPIYELAVRAKVHVETLLEQVMEDRPSILKGQIEELTSRINGRKDHIKRNFDVPTQMRAAEKYIYEAMKSIGSQFEFESSFDPINLHFSLDTFELWHEELNGNSEPKRIYLRSMGSGANWLYSHLTLFLALHRYFCHLGAKCNIPPILFLDQPSQVYFPTVLDIADEFSAEEIAKMDRSRSNRPIDEDIRAVTNLYSRMVEFCEDTKNETGIEPQIIITDHADKLKLSGATEFESLVRAKWRDRGLVNVIPAAQG
ncbi:MAG: DUF3732 domain-containing protein [Phycisphaerae bacterium]|jgi:hypothetical protein